jgi:hypothetical protein
MARQHGAIGLTRIEFEGDFYRYCEVNNFKPGFECARLMHRAAENNDTRNFVALTFCLSKVAVPDPVEASQDMFIVDRRREVASQ